MDADVLWWDKPYARTLNTHKQKRMNPEIYDEGDGISLELPFEAGFSIKVYMDDNTAQEMVNIIQNKLNARF
jgi:hypothetical protein